MDADSAVVVAVDDSAAAMDAVRWATHEAALLRRPLRIVAVIDDVSPHRTPWSFPPDYVHETARYVEARLTEADLVARTVSQHARLGDLAISTELLRGSVSAELVRRAQRSEVFVIASDPSGGRGLFSPLSRLLTSVNRPIVVVDGFFEQTMSPLGARVIVGVDGLPASNEAVARAFIEADRRRAVLHAVHVWGPDTRVSAVTDRAREEAVLAERLAGFSQDFPDVTVTTSVLEGDAFGCLARTSNRADLMIVGGRGRTALASLLLGSTGRDLAATVGCPLMIVRHPHPSTTPPRPWRRHSDA